MDTSPFLPGLVLALTVWVVPCISRFLPERLLSPIAQRWPAALYLAAWIWSFGAAYAGLLIGWISARDFGLTGQTLPEWALGAAAAILLGLALAWVSVRYSDSRSWGDVRGEARWSLYRGAIWPLVNFLPIAVAAGLLASIAEFFLWSKKSDDGFAKAAAVPFAARTVGSAALFLLAHNFTLAMVYYLTAYVATMPEVRGWIGNLSNRFAKIFYKE
jgi:hypothetical protein